MESFQQQLTNAQTFELVSFQNQHVLDVAKIKFLAESLANNKKDVIQKAKEVMEKFGVSKQEIEELKKMPYEDRLKRFGELYPPLISFVNAVELKEGFILIKFLDKTIQKWETKQICLNKTDKILSIKGKKKIRYLYLTTYKLEQITKGKEKYNFQLESLNNNNKYKKLQLGSEQQSVLEEWHQAFKQSLSNVKKVEQQIENQERLAKIQKDQEAAKEVKEIAPQKSEQIEQKLPQIAVSEGLEEVARKEPEHTEHYQEVGDEVQLENEEQFNEEVRKQIEEFEETRQDIQQELLTFDDPEIKELVRKIESTSLWESPLRPSKPKFGYNSKKQARYDKNGNDFIFKGALKRDDKTGHVQFISKEQINAQKSVIKFLLKKIGSNLLKGKSILNISVPLVVFENRSNLERFAYSLSYAPVYLEKAAQTLDKVEQLKYCITFLLSNSLLYFSMLKPFNPILGETFQGYINNCPVYCEQILHHPPICAIQMYGRGYTISGNYESKASINANSIAGQNSGYLKVTFHNTNASFTLIQPSGTLYGINFGEKYTNIEKNCYVYDLDNNLWAEAHYNPDKKNIFNKDKFKQNLQFSDFFIGCIFEVNENFKNRFKTDKKFDGINMDKEAVKELSVFRGFWDQEIIFDDNCLWNLFDGELPFELDYEENALASDCQYRIDALVWSKTRDLQNTQLLKEKYEDQQRNDKKLRKQELENRKKMKNKEK